MLAPIVTRILEGCCPAELDLFNAKALMDWVRDTDRHHTPEECRRSKDCVHAPGPMTVEWAATLTSKATVTCTCGEHGGHDPQMAEAYVAAFMARWSGDLPAAIVHQAPKKKSRRR